MNDNERVQFARRALLRRAAAVGGGVLAWSTPAVANDVAVRVGTSVWVQRTDAVDLCVA